jgi:hypothetical protein
MNDIKTLSRRQYVPSVLAATLVLVCLAVFNFYRETFSTTGLILYRRLPGWPVSDDLIFLDFYVIPEAFNWLEDRQRISVVFNLLFAVVMAGFAFIGVRQLQRANGRLFRIHLQTVLILTLTMAGFLYLNTEQKASWAYPSLYSGWPHAAVFTESTNDSSFTQFRWLAVAKNIFVALYGCFAVWIICESWIAWRARKTKS